MTYDDALRKAAAYCSQSEHCTSELKEKLIRWEVPSSQQDEIISYLTKENYLSEQRYAFAFAKDKFRYNKCGKIRIRFELQRKHLDEDLISNALEAIDEEDYLNQAVETAQTKLRGLKFKDSYERDGKLYRFLAGRGFEPEIIRQVIRKLNGLNE